MSSEFGSNLSPNQTTINCSTLRYAPNVSAKEPSVLSIGSTTLGSTNGVTQSHNKSPNKTHSSRFSSLVRIFKPWKWKRKKKSEKFENTSKGRPHL